MEKLSVQGFKAAGIAAGIKKGQKKDLGLIYSEVPANAAAVFTRNKIQAAPVILAKERITSGVCQAVIVNSGNANCCTGQAGLTDAESMARMAAYGLGIDEEMVLVSSTGVIGEPLPVDTIEAAVPGLVGDLNPQGFSDLAEAIMTTDTIAKTASGQGNINGNVFRIVAVAKGAGMIRPDMATMLCFACSDVDAGPEVIKETLAKSVELSFNRISIDGDTSTNDTVLVLANGLSGAAIQSPDDKVAFQKVLDAVLLDLAKQLVRDGEGATKLVEILVRGAATDNDARNVAETVAHSPLVKTAFFGEDANWGRIIGAVGRAGAEVDPDNIDVFFDNVQMVNFGMGCGKSVEAEATKVLKKEEFTVTIDLNIAEGSAAMLTCDFSVDYVRINADYRT
jgi:glutamate N-acetyltransferase/amino-acid N-acetyltransferase